MRFAVPFGILLVLCPEHAYACSGSRVFLEGIYLHLWVFTPAYLFLFALKLFFYKLLIKFHSSRRFFIRGVLPLIGGILTCAVFFAFYSEYDLDRGIVLPVMFMPLAACIFAMSYAAEKELMADKLQIKKNRNYFVSINLIVSLLLSLWFSMLLLGLQCSRSSGNLIKLNASSIQMDNVSVFE